MKAEYEIKISQGTPVCIKGDNCKMKEFIMGTSWQILRIQTEITALSQHRHFTANLRVIHNEA